MNLCAVIIAKDGDECTSLPFVGMRIFPNLIRYKKENFNCSFKNLKPENGNIKIVLFIIKHAQVVCRDSWLI